MMNKSFIDIFFIFFNWFLFQLPEINTTPKHNIKAFWCWYNFDEAISSISTKSFENKNIIIKKGMELIELLKTISI